MRVKCPRETMYTRDYSHCKSEIKLYAVRIIVNEKMKRIERKGKQNYIQFYIIHITKLHSTVNVNTAQWPSRDLTGDCAGDLAGDMRARVRAAGPSALLAAAPPLFGVRGSGLFVAAMLLLLELGRTGLAGSLFARALTSRAPEEPIHPTAPELSALVRKPITHQGYCRARVVRARALDLQSALRLGRRSRALRLGDVRLWPFEGAATCGRTTLIVAGVLDELDVLIRDEVKVEFSPDGVHTTSELSCFVHIWRICSLAGALGACLTSAGLRDRHRELTFLLRGNALGSSGQRL